MFYEVAQQQEALWPQLDLSIAAAQGTAPKIERKSRKTIGLLADRLHRLALSLREIGSVPWWRFQHIFRIFSPRSQDIVALSARDFARSISSQGAATPAAASSLRGTAASWASPRCCPRAQSP